MPNAQKYLGKTVKISIDRPLGSKHPQYGFSYSVNYGFVPGTISGDGEELDAYALALILPWPNLRENASPLSIAPTTMTTNSSLLPAAFASQMMKLKNKPLFRKNGFNT